MACWDLNGNGIGDPLLEDVNGDQVFDTSDCLTNIPNQLSFFLVSTSGVDTTDMGEQSFCFLTQSFINREIDAGGCQVFTDNGEWFLRGFSDSNVSGTTVCRAGCFR